MVGTLLLRGMLVGIVAGILCFAFLKIVGEPQVDRAIAFETQLDEAKAKAKADAEMAKGMSMPKEEPEPELVSRPVQAGIGLFTGVMVYNAAFGGLFALVFALTYGHGRLWSEGDLGLVGDGGHCRRLYRPEPEISGQPTLRRRPRYNRYAHGPVFCDDRDFLRGHDWSGDAAPRASQAVWGMECVLACRRRLPDRRCRRGARAADYYQRSA
jgi:hypothetical protein